MAETIRLACGSSSAAISLRGAELLEWTALSRSLLWTPDPTFWSETAPVLFPVVGWTCNGEIRVKGKRFPLGLHGFARQSDFRVQSATTDCVRLILESNATTRALYPFDFSLQVEHRLTDRSLATTLSVTNRGDENMPYACGLHPGFRWPFAGGDQRDYRIVFDLPEEPHVPVISPRGLFLPQKRPIALEGRLLALTPELFAREALCFLNAHSQSLRFEHEGGSTILIEMEDFPHIALWSKPGAPFLSIEAWTGHGDPEDFQGDIFAKPSMRILGPGMTAQHRTKFTFAV
jgi:galactose mutarotase-like enzyme